MSSTEIDGEVAKKRIYVGNLGSNVSSDELIQLFGLGTTPFLQKNCHVELPCCEKTGKTKNFAIVTVPEHVHSELMKLNGIEFYGRQIVIEEAKTKVDEGKKDKTKAKKGNAGRGRGRGRGRGAPGPTGRKWGPRPKGKFNLPSLEPDQIFHLVDSGVNLTNPKFNQY